MPSCGRFLTFQKGFYPCTSSQPSLGIQTLLIPSMSQEC